MLTKNEWLRVLAAVAGLALAALAAEYFAAVLGVRAGRVISTSVWVYLGFLLLDLAFGVIENWGGRWAVPRPGMVVFALTAGVGAAGRDALELAGMPQAARVAGVVMLVAMLGLVGLSAVDWLENKSRVSGG